MSKRTRRALFYGLLLLFPLLGGAIVLYAQGWRLDWTAFKVQKVGAMYVKSFPQQAEIRLNGKPIQNKSGILDRGTFIGNLFPKNYALTLSADGYLDWNEHVAVGPSLVSEIKYGVLIPRTPEKVAADAENFWIVNQEPLIQNKRGLLRQGKKLAGGRAIGWTNDFKKILTEDEKNGIYFINDVSTDMPTATNLNLVLKNLGIRSSDLQKVLIDPSDNTAVLLQTPRSISAFDIPSGEVTALEKPTSTITRFAASASWLAWTTFDPKNNFSRLTLYNRVSESRLDDEVLAGKTVKLDFRNNNELGILQNDGGFYIARAPEHAVQKTASDVRDFSFSPDEDSAALLENSSIEIFSFGSENGYWRFRLPDSGAIERLEWYKDGAHLFVVYPQEVRFLDLNDKALENFPVIAPGNSARYDEQSNKLYFVKNNELWSLEFPK